MLTKAGGGLGVIVRLSDVILVIVVLRDVGGAGLEPRGTEVLPHELAAQAQVLDPDSLKVSRDVVVKVLKTLTDAAREIRQLGYRALGGRGGVAEGPGPEAFLPPGEQAERAGVVIAAACTGVRPVPEGRGHA